MSATMTEPPPAAPGTAMLMVYAGVGLLTLGMIAVVGGLLVPSLFLPGTWIILIAFIVIIAGLILGAVRPRDAETPAASGR